MHQEDVENARNLISQSNILSSVEKAEWLQLLPDMNDKQILELIKILVPEQPHSQAVQLQPAVLSPQQQPYRTPPKADINQKEISTSIPFYEKELPPGKTFSPAAQQQVPAQKFSAPASPKTFQAQPPARTPIPRDLPKFQPQASNEKPKQPVKISFNSPEDFLGLTPQMLHDRDVYGLLQGILDSIVEFSKKEKFLPVIYNVERSPLQKIYVAFGIALLNDQNTDREQTYQRLIADAKAAQKDYLTKEEFEAFTDFRKELDKLLV